MSNTLAVYFLLECRYLKDSSKWLSVREVSSVIHLSVDRTRKHLSLLVLSGDLETKIDGWHNVYRFKHGR